MLGPYFRSNPTSVLRLVAIFGLLAVALSLHTPGGSSFMARESRIGLFAVGVFAIALIGRRKRSAAVASVGAAAPYQVGTRPPEPGWYPQAEGPYIQRYWNGTAWGTRRRWDGDKWILD